MRLLVAIAIPILLLLAACASDKALREENERLRVRVKELEQELWLVDQYRRMPDRPDRTNLIPEGKVLDTKTGEFGVLLVLSIGAEDGLRVGDVMNLRRGAQYVGRVTVDKLYKQQSVGLFDGRFPGAAAPPLKNDVVYANR